MDGVRERRCVAPGTPVHSRDTLHPRPGYQQEKSALIKVGCLPARPRTAMNGAVTERELRQPLWLSWKHTAFGFLNQSSTYVEAVVPLDVARLRPALPSCAIIYL